MLQVGDQTWYIDKVCCKIYAATHFEVDLHLRSY